MTGTREAITGRLALLLATLLVSSFFLISCSPSDTPTTRPSKTVIAFAALPHTALAQIAQVQGYFLQEGLDVSPIVHSYGKQALDEVLKGKADFATVAETPFMLAALEGHTISIIATIQTSPTNEAIVARSDRGILSIKDLRGKTVGATLGTTSDFFMNLILSAYGVSRKEVTVVDLKPGEMQKALELGEVDAVSAFVPHLALIQRKMGSSAITFHDEHLYSEAFNVVAQRQFIRRNPVMVQRVLRALVKAETFARSNPSESQRIVAEFIGSDRKLLGEIWDRNHFDVVLDQSLVLSLEDESLWAIKERLTKATRVPNYLDYIYRDGLLSVKPDAVSILQ